MTTNCSTKQSKIVPIAVFKGTPWSIYMSSQGKEYYFNSETSISVWESPTELKNIKPSPIFGTCYDFKQSILIQ
ncbi:hypothetical protein HZS_181 [Henneguya salminicola]|nr:hypothetical protein HZS_181 [Henneguya salminicola]